VEISENLLSENFVDWVQQQTRSNLLTLRIFRNGFTAR